MLKRCSMMLAVEGTKRILIDFRSPSRQSEIAESLRERPYRPRLDVSLGGRYLAVSFCRSDPGRPGERERWSDRVKIVSRLALHSRPAGVALGRFAEGTNAVSVDAPAKSGTLFPANCATGIFV
jgi:hypothetical protein